MGVRLRDGGLPITTNASDWGLGDRGWRIEDRVSKTWDRRNREQITILYPLSSIPSNPNDNPCVYCLRDDRPEAKTKKESISDFAKFEYCMQMTTTGTSHQDRSIARFIRRVGVLSATRYALTFSTAWLFLCGVAILAARAATGHQHLNLIWLAAGILPATVVAFVIAWRRLPNASTVRALLDNRSNSGGLLMASERAELGEWQQRLPTITQPRLRWRSRRTITLALASIAFASASFVVPTSLGSQPSDRPLDIAREVHELAADIDLLKKEEIIDNAQAESLETKLGAITADTKAEDPVKTWEALDRLQDNVSNAAREAAEKMARNNEQLGEAQALSEALSEPGSGIDPTTMTEAMKELQSLAQAASDQSPAPSLPSDLANGLKSGSLSKEQLKQLSQALQKNKGDLARKLEKLHDSRMIDLKTMKQCQSAGKCNSEGLSKFLKDNQSNMSVKEKMRCWGKGGVDRGRGDAPMVWTDPSSERGAKFKEQVLPSSMSGLGDSQLVGRSTGAPEIDKSGGRKSGALQGASAGGGSASTQTILPRHRGTVNRYFERR
jgi:hypothetical protein